jgi:glutamate 5-kinase
MNPTKPGNTRAGSGKARSPLAGARCVVVKVGSALLVDPRSGRLNRAWLEALVEDLLRLRRRGQTEVPASR